MNTFFTRLTIISMLSLGFLGSTLTAAQANTLSSQIQHRIDRLEVRAHRDVRIGRITRAEFRLDERELHTIQERLHRDEFRHGGSITTLEYNHLSSHLNQVASHI